MSEESHKRALRYDLSSIDVEISGAKAELLNVSATGILVSDVGATLPDGADIVADMTVPVFERRVGMKVKGTVIRHDKKGIAIRYNTPAKTWPHLLGILARKEGKAALA